MVNILCIETSTTNCSVSLAQNGKTVALKEDYSSDYSHAENLHLYIDAVLKQANVSEIDAVAISKGPGSFTGLRIGVSAAKGLSFALDKPLISVSTLQALAKQVEIKKNSVVVSMIDARRQEVYAQVFDANHNPLDNIRAEIISSHSFSDYLERNPVYFIGNGVSKTKAIITHQNAFFIEGKLPSASTMGLLAYQAYSAKNIEDVAYFEPYYLKDFVGFN